MQAVFARFTKADEKTRTVYGRATQEIVDRDNEVFDYATSKPQFEKWSAEVFQDTGGKSLGNVRAMHGNVSAGILKDITFDDTERAIDIAAKITDDNEWSKVMEGNYSGFSIGGRYSKKWSDILDGKMVSRYTAVPSEISIVDRPCCPTAKFMAVHKLDGSMRHVLPHPSTILKDFTPPATATSGLQTYDLEGGKPKAKKADAEGDEGTPRVQDANADDAIGTDPNAAVKRDFSEKERSAAADSGAAMSDGSFPIKSKQDLKNAVQAYGRAKDKAKAKAHIMARAKALGATGDLPDGWAKKGDGIAAMSIDELTKFFGAHQGQINDVLRKNTVFEFSKGVYDVSSLAGMIPQLQSLAYGAEREKQIEGDDSGVGARLRDAAAELLDILSDMAAEESQEIRTGTTMEDVQADMSPGLYRADVSEFAKSLRSALGMDELEKKGARHSAKDLERIQKIHDATGELGAACQGPHEHDGKSAALPTTEKLEKQESTTMGEATKADAVSTEGNKRGAAVTDPALPPESKNATNDSITSATDGATKSKARAASDAAAAAADDDDDDDDDAAKAKKARKAKKAKKFAKMLEAIMSKMDDDDDDDDDDEEDEPPKKKKAKKSDEGDLAKSIVNALTEAGLVGGNMRDARAVPNLMAVGKDGEVTKLDVAALTKSVDVHPHDAMEIFKKDGDNGTCTLIKGIHKNRVMLDQTDLRALGQIGALR